MNLINLLNRIISRLNKTLKAEYQVLTDAEKALVRDNIHAADKSEWCNPNLLDNWYFGNPVNQRGQASYSESYKYTIDRWLINDSTGTVSITDNGLTITRSGDYVAIGQRFEDPSWFVGKTITVSALHPNGRLVSGTVTLTSSNFDVVICNSEDGNGFFNLWNNGQVAILRIFNNGELPVNLIAVKMELGNRQTLAHQDANGNWVLNEIPSYTEELLKCQRYCKVYKDIRSYCYGNEYIAGIAFDSPMRSVPSVESISIERLSDGVVFSYGWACWCTMNGITWFYVPGVKVGEFYKIISLVASSDL